jgi:hypothetical protein
MAAGTPNQFGVKGREIKFSPSTKGNPVKHQPGTANLGSKVKIHRAQGK